MLKGAAGICFQAVFLREILSAFFGNEFSVGVVLSLWLLGGGIGSFLYRKTGGAGRRHYLYCTILQNLWAFLSLFFLRFSRVFFGVMPGQSFSLAGFFLVCFSICFVVGFLEGSRFVLLSSFYRGQGVGGRLYGAEGMGALTGGILMPLFLKANVPPFHLLGIFGFLNLASGLAVREKQRVLGYACGIWLVVLLLAPFLERGSLTLQWKPFDVVKSCYSVYGNSVILSSREQVILVRDGLPEMSNQPDMFSIKNAVFFSLAFQPATRRILLIGNPELMPEIVRYPVLEIYYVEPDPVQISLLKEYFLTREGRKVVYINSDPYEFLRTRDMKFDVVIVGRGIPLSLRENRFFSPDFLRLVKKRLTDSGLLCLPLPGNPDYLDRNLLSVHSSIYRTVSREFSHGRIILSLPIVYLFSNGNSLTRLRPETAVDQNFFNRSYLNYTLNPARESAFRETLKSDPALPNTGSFPVTTYYVFSCWFSKFSSQWGEVFRSFLLTLISLKKFQYPIFFLLFVLWVLPCRKVAVVSGVSFTNGLAALGLEMILLFLFQMSYGSLYFLISLLVGSFMAGLGLGGMLSGAGDRIQTWFVRTEIFQVVFYSLAGLSVLALARFPAVALFIVLLLSSGFLLGWEFGILTGVLKKDSWPAAVGKVYSLDLLGGLAGSIGVPFLLLPAFGVNGCLYFFTLVKLANCLTVYRLTKTAHLVKL